jgi:hypothetical protein
MKPPVPLTIDEYIASAPAEVQDAPVSTQGIGCDGGKWAKAGAGTTSLGLPIQGRDLMSSAGLWMACPMPVDSL